MVALVVPRRHLGIAGLYVTTLRSGGGAIFRHEAVNLAADWPIGSAPIAAQRGLCGAAANKNTVTVRARGLAPGP